MSEPGERLSKLDAVAAAKLIKVTPRRLQQLAREGWITKPYTVLSVVHGYIDSLHDQMKRQTLKFGESRISEMRASKMEFELASARRAVIPTDLAVDGVSDVLGPLRADLEGLPAAFTRDMEERKRLEALLDEFLNSAARRCAKVAADLRAGGDNSDAKVAAVARRLGSPEPPVSKNRRRSGSAKSKPHAVRRGADARGSGMHA